MKLNQSENKIDLFNFRLCTINGINLRFWSCFFWKFAIGLLVSYPAYVTYFYYPLKQLVSLSTNLQVASHPGWYCEDSFAHCGLSND